MKGTFGVLAALSLLGAGQVQAGPHDVHEMEVELNAADVYLQMKRGRPNPEPMAFRLYVAAHVDPSTGPGMTRLERLVSTPGDPHGLAVVCFRAMGIRWVSLALAREADEIRELQVAANLRLLAGRAMAYIQEKCGGPGGDRALREWEVIDGAARKKVGDYLQRTTQPAGGCWPIPSPLVTACAPTREEIYMPKTAAEWSLLCAGLAAGFVAPPLAAALRGLTWAEVFAVATAAAPAVAR